MLLATSFILASPANLCAFVQSLGQHGSRQDRLLEGRATELVLQLCWLQAREAGGTRRATLNTIVAPKRPAPRSPSQAATGATMH